MLTSKEITFMTRKRTLRNGLIWCGASLSLLGFTAPVSAQPTVAGTPVPYITCESWAASTPVVMDMNEHDMDSMELAEFDLAYIDMMIPHHASIIALAEVSLPLLTDQRLIDMANAIIETQVAEQNEMQLLRHEFYPNAPAFDATDHELLHNTFPSLTTWSLPMEEWANVMSADWQVTTFCASDTPDLAFVQQTIPHHEMAILASQDALTLAIHPEIKSIAERVIPAQQSEIDLLKTIEAELTSATPAA